MMPISPNFLLLIFCLGILTFSLHAQENKFISGIVISNDESVPGVFIENLRNGQRIITNDKGAFTIKAKPADSLAVAYSDQKFFILVLAESDFADDLLEIDLNQMSIELDAVIIQDVSNINAFDLGIIDHPMEVPTPYERRLYTAGDFKMIHLLSILGGSLKIDPIINKISGRTKRMKRNIEIEGRVRNLAFLKEKYGTYITESFTIEETELNRFLYYLVEETDVATLIRENHDAQLKFFIQDFWIRYQELIAE